MKFKAIVVDIDGTITCENRELHLGAVKKIRSLKVPVVLATGNILCYARTTSKLIGLDGAVIAENGGAVTVRYDLNGTFEESLEECEKAFSFLSEHFQLTKLDPFYRKTEIALRRNFDLEKARALLKTQPFDVEMVDTKYAVHIKSTKIDKGSGLRKLAGMMGLEASDFVAIGDSANDVELFEAAGFGIAVANGDEKIKEAANYVTEASFGEGAVEAFEYLELKGWI
ncbi:phosphoglycolate phosphatase [Methanosarcina sp. 2.H.T.1A.6]|uniref:phosphoglycolate phosphatase n=1 Tax=unclassified Methanosarcina TaxID=2644672 RepID=UPI000622960E|nr:MULTISPECIES: phosphoglycolate phosphatase [unclassified Methanosarcina]KKG11739.1 phosphoglycolate phosphatase [Methanosarcina sp. 2.H.T.1A.15]KKG17633.1 phosphoglycolate phosphatase [Methanosarcina sp. 2.H.T.1A.3]KKG21873.1 phosphoglycolate phosphatase [Methanosarcina sp. 2.H.T.1A.6]KKG25409.1 phosphoglycolate phosphatase [Methanosarcina sp. 2.H.T.1A.8]